MALRIKTLYDYPCQVCGTRLSMPGDLAYAEGAHIRPLGIHLGPDIEENMLCLCPNHHVSFDRGALFVTDHLEVVDSASGNQIGTHD